MQDDDILNMLKVNVYHPMLLAKAFADKNKFNRKGKTLIMLSSLSAFIDFPGGAIYSATKKFDLILGQFMQNEGWKVVIHSPLAVQSNMTVKKWSWVFLPADIAAYEAMAHEGISN
jgi:short-subunit dehydrogenase